MKFYSGNTTLFKNVILVVLLLLLLVVVLYIRLRLASSSQSFCLGILSAETVCIHHHTQIICWF